MKTFCLPDLGEGLQEAEVVSWHVNAGDRVVEDQPLVSVETDKAVVDIPSPWSGRVVELFVAPGDMLAIGAPLARFDIDGGHADAGAIVGTLPQVARETAPVEQAAPVVAGERVKAVPAARRRAGQLGIELSAVAGNGPDGTITLADVEAASANGRKPARADGWEPLRGVRRAMARNMAKAHSEVATATVTDEATLLRWSDEWPVTLELIRAVGAACLAEPALNAWYDHERGERILHDHVDLGMAVNTEDGLFVPVLRGITGRSAEDLAAGLEAIKRDTVARTIPKAELEGQTITLSNFGTIGGRHAALVILPPQVAIIGAGRITTEARVIEGEVRAVKVMPLSLTFDHRAVTGAEAARFLMAIIGTLEKQDVE